jgi:glutathione peroxidase
MAKIFFMTVVLGILTTSFYDFSINDIDGNTINFSQFQGKKVLIVNTASGSTYASQYQSLEQLYQKYKDSLVIVAVPSNSFGNEPLDNSQIKSFIATNYNTHFIISEKAIVDGESQSPLFSFLSHIEQNGMVNNPVKADFFKFLINSSGTVIGTFAPSVDPMSDDVQNAITQ